MLTTQTHIGQTPLEIDNLQEEHKQVENTAAVSTQLCYSKFPYYKKSFFFVYNNSLFFLNNA